MGLALVTALLDSVVPLLGKLSVYRSSTFQVLIRYSYCGTTSDYCTSPDCQYKYSDSCDGQRVPAGASTSTIARTKVGNVAYGGAGIYDCVNVGDVALTFDDGPYLYTTHMLDILESYNASATFFITGNNNGKGMIDNVTTGYPAIIKRMYNAGHQVASHTWSHQNLTALDPTTFHNQVYYNEMALRNVLGVIPTYLRPPYSECNNTCGNLLGDLGYHVTYFSLDTEDYLHDSASLIQQSKDIFSNALSGSTATTGDFLAIGHDIHYQTAYNLTTFMLDTIKAKGYKPVTVGDCLGDPKANWYRDASGTASTSTTQSAASSSSTSTSAAAASTLKVSSDATCGNGNTCSGSTFGNCCSSHGYCGSTSDYCGTGCQSGFGTCGTSSSVATTSTTAVAKVVSTSATTSAKASSTALTVSKDGTCGSTTTCKGSTFGLCCSQNGWCGSTTAYCKKSNGCKVGFGTCT